MRGALLTMLAGAILLSCPALAQEPGPAPRADLDALRRTAMNSGGDARRGKVLFASPTAQCASCHKIQGQGGDLGPDLSQVGGKFDRTHLIEAILDPSAEITQGYHATTIETKTGRVLTGIVKSESSATVTLLDIGGKPFAIAQGDIESRTVSKVSLMPSGLADAMTPAEFTDLIDYLASLRTGRAPTPGEGSTAPLTLPPGFKAEVVATGLTGATAFEAAPDGRLFVCEQTGTLRVVKQGRLLAEPFVKLPVDATWERGLIGVTIAPDFPKTPHVFVCYVAVKPYPHHVISRFTAVGDAAESGSEKVLFEGDDQTRLGGTVPAGHQGGAVHFGHGGKLFIAIGDQTAGKPAQDLSSVLGKLLRINVDGSIPEDNPFFARTTGKYRAVWALGLRNPFTFAVQSETGRLFINDVGGIAEEVNEGVAGANYGWPTVEHGPTNDPHFRGPIHHYPTACICGGAFAPHKLDWPKHYRGRYFFGDFNHGWIKTLDPDRPAVAKSFATGLRRPVDLHFAADGCLYVLLRDAWVIDKLFKSGSGVVLRIRPADR
jgi:putative heme-binding domain-containing protein